MARIRSVKPEYWADQELAEKVSRDARLAYIGLWNMADEWARLRGDARHVKGQLFPYDDDLTPEAVDDLIGELVAAGKVVRYVANGGTYLFLPTLHKHQRLEPDRVPSRLPSPPDPDEPALFGADELAPRPNGMPPLGANGNALSREQGAGSRGQGTRAQTRTDPPPDGAPPRTCATHPKGTNARCGPCRDARLAFEVWEAEAPRRDAQRRRRIAEAPRCVRHPNHLADHCPSCAGEAKGRK